MKLYYDNKIVYDITYNLVQHDRTKHVEINRHFIKEKLKAEITEISDVRLYKTS
jgi:hypothetical protein